MARIDPMGKFTAVGMRVPVPAESGTMTARNSVLMPFDEHMIDELLVDTEDGRTVVRKEC